MDVELIYDEDPFGLWIGGYGLPYVGGEILVGAGRTYRGSYDPARGHLQVGEQASSAVALILVLLALDQPGTHRKRRMNSLQCLYPTLLVCAYQMRSPLIQT